jgi:hypothetical protein
MLAVMKNPGWVILPALTILACHSQPPPNWEQGGSPIEIPRARWTRGDKLIDIMPDGHVLGDGEHLFTIDRAGRVYQPDHEPIAVLQPDGRLVGKDNTVLGKIGLRNSSAPGKQVAWVAIGDRGEVLRYDPDGDARVDGAWTGCEPAVRSCTLTTHIIALVETQSRRSPIYGPGVGVGIGVGFGMVVPR